MTGTQSTISDEELQSFVDGELGPARKKAMRSRLAASPADSARAEAWRRQNDALRAAFADFATDPSPPFLPRRFRGEHAEAEPSATGAAVPEASNGGLRRGRAAAVGLGLAFAAGAATTLAVGLLAERFDMRHHLRSGREPRGSLAHGTDEPFVDRTLRDVADLGTAAPISADLMIIPNLSDAGLRLARIRVRPGSLSLPLCLHYLTGADVEVTLCLDTTRTETAMPRRKDGDESAPTITWRQNGARYSLAGPLADGELGLLADRARAEVAKFSAR